MRRSTSMASGKRWLKRAAILGIGVAVLVLNPWFGLTGGYDFGAPEMRAAIEGTWQLTLTPVDGPPRTIQFKVAQGDAPIAAPHASRTWMPQAAACGSRSLVKPAGACMTITDMPVDITVLADASGPQEIAKARFSVAGDAFTTGDLLAQLRGIDIEARVTPDGRAVSTAYVTEGPAHHLPSTLQRIAR